VTARYRNASTTRVRRDAIGPAERPLKLYRAPSDQQDIGAVRIQHRTGESGSILVVIASH
jgi:hypothetical protein